MSRFKTIKEATEAWIHEMNAIPQGMISQLFQDHPDDWTEVTKPSKYDRVYVFDNGDYGEITDIDEETEEYIISLDNGEEIKCENGECAWLEKVNLVEEYTIDSSGFGHWVNKEFE